MKSQMSHTLQFFFLILALTSLMCGCSAPDNPGGTTDQQDTTETDVPQEDADPIQTVSENDLWMKEQGFVMPDMPGTTIPLDAGRSIFIPEGALPQETAIDAQISKNPPLLPEGIAPVGDTLFITADAQPQSPVLLRMAIPAGVDDPNNLVILRTSSDGMTTALITWVDDDDLLAYTPGFSQFSIGKFIGEFVKEQNVNISYKSTILTGQRKTISVTNIHPDQIFDAIWTVNNKATLLQQGDVSATIQAGEEEGWIMVTYTAINLTQGLRWFGHANIQVERPSQGENNSGATWQFQPSITSENTALYEDEALSAVVSFYGQFSYPITWSYSVSDCLEAVKMSTTDAQPIAIPPIKCPSRPLPYSIKISAQDADGTQNYAFLYFQIFSKPFMINIDGPRTLEWRTGGVKGSYTATTNDGYKNPDYSYTWRITPGGDWSPIESRETAFWQELTFNQPGENRLEVRTTDGKGNETKAIIPVMVTGADPLDAHILSWPDPIIINEVANFSFRAGGGTLVTGGQNGGYKVSILWGDGTTVEESKVGMVQLDYAPITFDFSHQWAQPGPYTVMLFVEDPAGNIAYAEADIVVNEKASSDRYEGVVMLEYMGFQQTLESFVELTITGESVTAVVEFTYVFEISFPDSGKYCKETYYHYYSGQGLLTNPLSLEMALSDHAHTSEGDCNSDDPSWDFSTTLVGDFYEDGGFSGKLFNQEGQEITGFTINASKVD